MNQTNTQSYAEIRAKIEEIWDEFWQNTIHLTPHVLGHDAALRFVQALQKGDQRLRVMFDVPLHVNRALRRMLMIRQIGESDDD